MIIPVRNAGPALGRCLDGIEEQEAAGEVEVVVVDSSSTDGSAELARARGARVHVIPVEKFNHGATRNLGADLARGDILVFTTQDAHAADCRWLERLVSPLEDERVAGVYGRQLAHDHATPPERYFLDFLYGERPRVQTVASPAGLSMDTTLFSNVNAAIPRRLWERFRFVDNIIMSEDQEWASRVLLAGYRLVYEPRAAVRHSHAYTLGSAFKRFFDSGASADRAYLAGARPSGRALRRNALRYARGELAWLRRTGQLSWVPYAALYEAAKFLGLQLGARHRWLPPRLKMRLSALPSYWEAHGPAAGGRSTHPRGDAA